MVYVHDDPEKKFNNLCFLRTIMFESQSDMNLKLTTENEQGYVELCIQPKMKCGFIMTKVDKDAPYKYLIKEAYGA